MNKLAFLRLSLGAMLLVGCSTSGSKDKDKDTSTRAGAGDGAAGSKAQAGRAGSTASGTGKEGTNCTNDTSCAAGLGCVFSPLDDKVGVKVCARRCTDDPECMTGERCTTVTGKPSDAHCWNIVNEAFKACGPTETAACGGTLQCVFAAQTSSIPEGVCVNFCALPGSSITDPSLITCPAGQTCLPLGDEDVGLCAKEVERGEKCGLEAGSLCGVKDLCVTEISNMMIGDSHCYQDCTKTMMCDDGKMCMPLDDSMFCD